MRPVYRVRVTASDVGSRVTLRARTHTEGDGPGLTDTVGLLIAWDDDVLVVERRDGARVSVAAADLVAGRVIPAPPPRRRPAGRPPGGSG